ncbi:MAG: DUF5668 domain-containing protein [Salinivirgaceae bacterium]|nr:DUF5668 domain-containing protein [Salinivirgaceae bacterium]
MSTEMKSMAKRNMTGLLFVAFGTLLLLNNFNILPNFIVKVVLSWKMIFIAIGLISLAGKNYSSAIVLFLIGGFLILPDIIHIPISCMELFWPVLIIIIGFSILAQRKRFRHASKGSETLISTEYIDDYNLFGGGKRVFQNPIFKGGKITNIFGGSEIDFKGVELAEGNNFLELTCVFGGSKLFIPADWTVKNDVISILGGLNDMSKGSKVEDSGKILVITGRIVFGGAEIFRV